MFIQQEASKYNVGDEIKYGVASIGSDEFDYIQLNGNNNKYKIIALMYYLLIEVKMMRMQEIKKVMPTKKEETDILNLKTSLESMIANNANFNFFTFFKNKGAYNKEPKKFMQELFKENDLLAYLITACQYDKYGLTIIKPGDSDEMPELQRHLFDFYVPEDENKNYNIFTSYFIPKMINAISTMYVDDKYVGEEIKNITQLLTEDIVSDDKKISDFLATAQNRISGITNFFNTNLNANKKKLNGIQYTVVEEYIDDADPYYKPYMIEINDKKYIGGKEILYYNDYFIQCKKDEQYLLIDKVSGAIIISNYNLLDGNHNPTNDDKIQVIYDNKIYNCKADTGTKEIKGTIVGDSIDRQYSYEITLGLPSYNDTTKVYESNTHSIITTKKNNNFALDLYSAGLDDINNTIDDALSSIKQFDGATSKEVVIEHHDLLPDKKEKQTKIFRKVKNVFDDIKEGKGAFSLIFSRINNNEEKYPELFKMLKNIQTLAKIGSEMIIIADKEKCNKYNKDTRGNILKGFCSIFFEDLKEFITNLQHNFKQKDNADLYFFQKTICFITKQNRVNTWITNQSHIQKVAHLRKTMEELKNQLTTNQIKEEKEIIQQKINNIQKVLTKIVEDDFKYSFLLEDNYIHSIFNEYINDNIDVINNMKPDPEPEEVINNDECCQYYITAVQNLKLYGNIQNFISNYKSNAIKQPLETIRTEECNFICGEKKTKEVDSTSTLGALETYTINTHDIDEIQKNDIEYDVLNNYKNGIDAGLIKQNYERSGLKYLNSNPKNQEAQEKYKKEQEEKREKAKQIAQQRKRQQDNEDFDAIKDALTTVKELAEKTFFEKIIDFLQQLFGSHDSYEAQYNKAIYTINKKKDVFLRIDNKKINEFNQIIAQAYDNLWSTKLKKVKIKNHYIQYNLDSSKPQKSVNSK